MAFKPGQSGNPNGAPKRDKFLTQHLISELKAIDPETQVTKARRIVVALIDKAMSGDVIAAREVLDRIEGKAIQVNENHNITYRAGELSDDELAGIVADRSGDGAAAPPGDSPKPH